MEQTSIVLVDDHQIVRQGLRVLLEQQADFQVVGEAGDGLSALKMVGQLTPDIVIMDIGMPQMNGIDATRQLVAQYPEIKVIALSMHADGGFIHEILAAGAMGYLLKESAYEELVNAIRTVLTGRVYVSEKIANLIVDRYIHRLQHERESKSAALSSREREVWVLLANGYSSHRIADELHLSVRTVETYRKNVMDKLEVHSVADLTKLALREGVITLDA